MNAKDVQTNTKYDVATKIVSLQGPLALFPELSVFYFSISSINCHGDGVAFIT